MKIYILILILIFGSNLYSRSAFYPNFMKKQQDIKDFNNKYYGIKLIDGTGICYGFINEKGILKYIKFKNELKYNFWGENKTNIKFNYLACKDYRRN